MHTRHGKARASRGRARRFGAAVFCAVVVSLLMAGGERLQAGGPYGADYCTATDRVFWFIHMSDTHIGTSGTTDTSRLTWVVTTGRATIKPLFTVVTGDLTDSTNGNIFGYPNGPYASEWQSYRNILDAAGVTTDDYYDIPGNHDAYRDRLFSYYKTYGIQGKTFASTGQVAWTKTLPTGEKYHFVAVNTADNTGAAFSISWPYGDYAGLDATELTALESDLGTTEAKTANLSFVFGHHPVTSTGNSQDTNLYYGAQKFVSDLDLNGVLGYRYGHVHDNVETHFKGDAYTQPVFTGFRYSRVASLGKSSGNNYSVVSVDCNGVNAVTQPTGTWPLVLITAPVDHYVGGVENPFDYDVPAASANPVRALVFDAGTVSQVRFRIDGGTTWNSMSRSAQGSPQWVGTWNASALAAGIHTIEVQAVGTTTRSHIVSVNVVAGGNRPPAAVDDGYATQQDKALAIAAPGVLSNDGDPDGNQLTASLVAAPGHGTLVLQASGAFTYTPVAGFVGTDTFTYQATDGTALSNTATVSISVAPSPTVDRVTITLASYTTKNKTLRVEATSDAAPTAKLSVSGYGSMTYNSTLGRYVYQKKVSPAPSSVTVVSSAGGSDNYTVQIK